MPGETPTKCIGGDSYFIIRGLLRSGRIELARGMVDNFFFKIENYGAMLNANRTYYLTRSHHLLVRCLLRCTMRLQNRGTRILFG